MITADEIRSATVAYMLEDVAVSALAGRVACSTPIEYPDGDRVVAWVTSQNGSVLVTDYGKGFERILSHPPQARATLRQLGRSFAAEHGIDFYDGRMSATVDASEVGEAVWRVAAASAQLAQAGVVFRPKKRKRERDFTSAVETTFVSLAVDFESHFPIEGASGRTHHATFFLRERPAVIEPVAPTGIWSQVSSVYAKFGDIAHKHNGSPPLRFSLIDDRAENLNATDAEFLGQVSEVIPWSGRESLLEQVT
jgi:hypothetical protein